jgi:hypothetical protein
VCLVEDDIYGGVAGAIDYLALTLVNVLVYYNGQSRDKYKDGGDRYSTIFPVA